jgi:nucleotide-binding universal stress UspA family protein
METPGGAGFAAEYSLLSGPIVLGTAWNFPGHLARTAAGLAAGLGRHLVCAFVDPASYLTEWEPAAQRVAASLDPAVSAETAFPPGHVLERLETILGPPGRDWSFRVLNGDVSQALSRMAANANAPLLVVGGPRPGSFARLGRLLEGSVSSALIREQGTPVLVVPWRESPEVTDW